MAGSACPQCAQPTCPGSLITRMKGTFETVRRATTPALVPAGWIGFEAGTHWNKISVPEATPNPNFTSLPNGWKEGWLKDGKANGRRDYSEVTAYIHRTRNGSFQTGWLEATVESRARLQYCQFCVVMNQVSENHEAGLKSEGVSENTYLEFFGFTFFVSAFIAYSASHFYGYLQT